MKIEILLVTSLSVLCQLNLVTGNEQEKYPKSQSFTSAEVDEMVEQIFETMKPSDFDNGAGPGVGIDIEEEKLKFKNQWSRENKNVADKLKGLELVLKNIKLKHADLENSESFSFAENLEFLLDCNNRAKDLLDEAIKIGLVFDFQKGEKLQQDFSQAIGIHTDFNSAMIKLLVDFESNKLTKGEIPFKVAEIRVNYPEVFDSTRNDDFATGMASSVENMQQVKVAMEKAAELLDKVRDLEDEWAKASLLAHLKMEVEPLIILPSQKADELLDLTVNMDVLQNLLQKYKELEGLRNNVLTEKNPDFQLKLEHDLSKLEKEIIPDLIRRNSTRAEFQKLGYTTAAYSLRGMEKLHTFHDTTIYEITAAHKKTEELLVTYLDAVKKDFDLQEEVRKAIEGNIQSSVTRNEL